MRRMGILGLVLAIAAAQGSLCEAEVSVAKIFGEGMVLQRGMKLPVWGEASPGEQVEVDFAGQAKKTAADGGGHWRVELDPLEASAKGRTLTVKGSNTLELKDVLVGEVWVCSGQSNMEYPLDRKLWSWAPRPGSGVKDLASEAYASADDTTLRIFRVEKKLDTELPSDGWHVAEGKPVGAFSAVGYFFGKDLKAKLNVPVGLIGTYWGGSRIERWTPEGAYAESSVLRGAETQPGKMDGDTVGKYYSRMVGPMAGYGIKGMIWYQGESNLIETNNLHYVEKFEVFADAWRKAWGEGDFPIGTVQIAPLYYTKRVKDPVKHTPETLPEFWQMQKQAAEKVKNVGLVPTADLADHLTNIHPWDKWDVGQRLANWALATVYGEKGIEWAGPMVKEVTHDGGAVEVAFSHGEGLKGAGAEIRGFQVEAADGKWVDANATADGEGKVRVTAEGVNDPRGVRYGWREDAKVGLRNGAGLPAIAFEREW